MPSNAIKNWNKNYYCSSSCFTLSHSEFFANVGTDESKLLQQNSRGNERKRLLRRFVFVHINWVKLKLVLLRLFEFTIL